MSIGGSKIEKFLNRFVKDLEYPEYASTKRIKPKIDLSLSENIFTSKNVLNELKRVSYKVNEYKLSQDPELLDLISDKLSVKQENILITAGCDYALHHVAETFIEPGDKVVIPVPCFGRYEFHTKVCGGIPVLIKFSQPPNEIDLETVKKYVIESRAKIVFLGNPNNPTGHLIPKSEMKKFIDEMNETLVIVDEALIDALPKNSSCVDLVDTYPNLIVTRSFSKFYGLAGMRIGYLVACEETIKHISKTVSPFEVSSLSIELAKIVLKDEEFHKQIREISKRSVEILKSESPLPVSNTSAAVALLYGENKIPDLYQKLLSHGILTVNGKAFRGLEDVNCVRITLHNGRYLKILIETLKEIISV